MKPMLASDWEEQKLVFPVIAQPKIDGVRALNMVGRLTGRSLKEFKNKHVTSLFSHSALIGLDGEMAAEKDTHPDLCRLTTSALGTILGEPFLLWWCFDYVTPGTAALPYRDRFMHLAHQLQHVQSAFPHIGRHLRLIPSAACENIDQLLSWDAYWLEQGFEGTIVRRPDAPHKQGRSTAREGGLARIKRFVDFEFTITSVIEGEENTNEAKLNELGLTERSTHQANMIPNGMVGAMLGVLLSDVKDGDKVLHRQGEQVRVGAGCLTHGERAYYFQNQNKIIGRVGKAKLFPKGIKDKPRFPTFQSFRDAEDMS